MVLFYGVAPTCVCKLLSFGRAYALASMRKPFSGFYFLLHNSQSYFPCNFSTSCKRRYSSSVKKTLTDQQTEGNARPVKELVEDIVHGASKTDKMIVSVEHSKIKILLEKLFLLGFSEVQLLNMFIEKPNLLRQHKLISSTEFLFSYGFSVSQIVNMFTSVEKITKIAPSRIQQSLETLRNSGFKDTVILCMLSSHPQLMFLNPGEVVSRVLYLKELFKSRDVIDLIEKNPDIIFQEWDTIQEKFDYVHHVMGVSQRQMMYTHMFSYPLKHIQCRHVFLVRAGFYTKPRKKEGEININPKLQEIIDTPDTKFAKQFGRMTLLDYRVFCELFEKEDKPSLDELMDET